MNDMNLDTVSDIGKLALHYVEHWLTDILGIVVQNFVSLTLSLSPQLVNYISISKANALLFFVEKI